MDLWELPDTPKELRHRPIEVGWYFTVQFEEFDGLDQLGIDDQRHIEAVRQLHDSGGRRSALSQRQAGCVLAPAEVKFKTYRLVRA